MLRGSLCTPSRSQDYLRKRPCSSAYLSRGSCLDRLGEEGLCPRQGLEPNRLDPLGPFHAARRLRLEDVRDLDAHPLTVRNALRNRALDQDEAVAGKTQGAYCGAFDGWRQAQSLAEQLRHVVGDWHDIMLLLHDGARLRNPIDPWRDAELQSTDSLEEGGERSPFAEFAPKGSADLLDRHVVVVLCRGGSASGDCYGSDFRSDPSHRLLPRDFPLPPIAGKVGQGGAHPPCPPTNPVTPPLTGRRRGKVWLNLCMTAMLAVSGRRLALVKVSTAADGGSSLLHVATDKRPLSL
mmetsp:Transcript_80964/g.203744  ORF Transcript_80964/g.203744 Transcript_80964/m.203744 type:complete len:294 (+) Transcript_80964:283-1164(+)